MKKIPDYEDEDILASTLSTHDKTAPRSTTAERFERVNVLLPRSCLELVDDRVHELKALGLRWVNRSLLIRHCLGMLEETPSVTLAPALADRRRGR